MGVLLSLPFVQTQLGKVATNSLNEEFGTDIRIGRVAISPFLTVKLGDVLVRDHHKDTLFYIKRLNTSILNFKKLYDNGHPYLGDVSLHGLDARIVQYKNEDETNLDIVEFNLDYYKAYKKGFLEKMNDTLTPTEIDYLPLAAKTMTFIMALRFLTDYLNNDIYYKTKYQEHNFDRAKNQFKLIDSFTERYNQL